MNDALYKQLFSHPEIVRDLVAGFLVADWAQALEVGAFERVNASYASDGGKARHEDVVWRARIGGEWVYVYILLEFQARPERWMALRMQVYIGLLYQDLVAQRKLSKHGKLPPVLPIVLYHGRRRWRAATTLTELMLPPPAGLACYQAQQRYLLIDQHHDALRGNLVGLLFRVARARSRTELEIAAAEIAARLRQPDLASARASVVRWLQLTLQDDFYPSMMDLEEDDMKRKPRFCFEEVFTDEFFDRLLGPGEEALRESARQGVQQGIEQGMQDGERLTLQGVLRDMLAGEDVEAELAAADNTQLRAWIHSLITSVPRPGASPSRNP